MSTPSPDDVSRDEDLPSVPGHQAHLPNIAAGPAIEMHAAIVNH